MGTYGLDHLAIGTIGGMVDIDVLPGGRIYADKQLIVSRTTSPDGLRFAGEIDASNSHAIGTALASAHTPHRDIHAEVASLLFCDISGVRAFVAAAEALPAGRRLLLHGMPPQLETVIKVVGWNRMPTLVMCKCDGD
ncbi:MAG TPA: STAS domain-containing protein [Candidatus Dormibacteraeota bacterium]|jgi:anti-anti-sigma regulatory factor